MMTKKLSLAIIACSAWLLSCTDSATKNETPSSEGLIGLSSIMDPLSSQTPFSAPLGNSSSDMLVFLSSSSQPQIDVSSGSLSSPILSSAELSATTLSSSSAVQVPVSSSAPLQDPTHYEKLDPSNAQAGWGSRYWDACKPHCAFRENVDTLANPFSVARSCNIDGTEIPSFTLSPNISQYWTGYEGTKSACETGGKAFTCMDMAPIAINDTLAYAYGAGSKSSTQCGQCFQIQFTGEGHDGTKAAHTLIKGKTLILMTSNIGTDVQAGQFDIMIPGGGVGIYNALSTQVNATTSLGEQYGGFLTTCQRSLNNYDLPAESYKTCVREKCQAVFGTSPKYADLLRGCNWFVDWMQAADNPKFISKPVACPAYLGGKYKSTINTTKDTDITATGW